MAAISLAASDELADSRSHSGDTASRLRVMAVLVCVWYRWLGACELSLHRSLPLSCCAAVTYRDFDLLDRFGRRVDAVSETHLLMEQETAD